MIPWRIFPRARIQSLLVVLRFIVVSFALYALVFPRIVHADDSEKDRAFAQLVREGDRARLEGRNPEALVAYQKANALRPGPLLLGRIGLVYLDGGLPVQAATHLYRALIDISDIPQSERWSIQEAYSRARSAVVRIKVDVSHAGANVTMDDEPQPIGDAANQFYFFTTHGHHEIRAKLAGYEDAVANIDVQKGQTELVSLVLKPIPQPPPAPVPPPAPTPHEKRIGAPATNIKPSFVIKLSPWSVGAGVIALSGAISYLPAMGPTAAIEYHYGEWLSFPLSGRVAWSPKYDTTWKPVRGITFGGSLGACANRSIYFACLVGHFTGIGHSLETQNDPVRVWKSRFGLGPVAGVVLPFHREFSVRIGAELIILSDGAQVLVGSDAYPIEVWSGPPILGGFSLTLVWRPELRVLR